MFVRISALASKMDIIIINQIKALYQIKYPLISIMHWYNCVHLFLFIWSILEAWADILTKISLVFGRFEGTEIPFRN